MSEREEGGKEREKEREGKELNKKRKEESNRER